MIISMYAVTIILILANVGVSLYGFYDRTFRERYVLNTGRIRLDREYGRLLVSAFLHGDWWHLLFNMYTLYAFGEALHFYSMPTDLMPPTPVSGMLPVFFVLLYLFGLLGSDLMILFLRRHDNGYRALGASGAISALVFATIIWIPDLRIWFLPGWLFAMTYLMISLYGVRHAWGNISHDAHLGGALAGMLFAVAYYPGVVSHRPAVLLVMLLPALALGVWLYLKPDWQPRTLFRQPPARTRVPLPVNGPTSSRSTTPQEFRNIQDEIDHLLDKGLDKLSSRERKRLEELSRKLDT
ncbi:MAG: hypothetical protein OHK0039_31350 [Bacteroidia bacterium]